ncbi:hypothetical protein LX64_02590 [Chitinophaga skermanii]|uniref:Uncharacterized protein n=1 Tax=Chitinophaga skermanii TaxID=331697 RepID=A0A327QP56_9BACT|nr:hypothetical protein [Chitinophaga skermanii]RAJ05432.1 hypothetical protein LX64_02590 [Chitinophaga skermanii]
MKRISTKVLTGLLLSVIIHVIGCKDIYKAGNLVALEYPVETQLRSKIIREYLDTLILKRGYMVPPKWESFTKLVDLDSVYNKRIYFRQEPEEMYLLSFGGAFVLTDVFNPNIRKYGYVSDPKLMPAEEEQRVMERLQHEILDTIVAMAKRNNVPDSVLYKEPI